MQEKIEKIIRGGGTILLRHFGKTTKGDNKEWQGDTESEADRETEAYLVAKIAKAFPGDAIMTEEHPEYTPSKNGRLWIIDALDGSRNFVDHVPLFGISIALVFDNRVQFGMVYLPIERELFWATRGKGAFLNGARIHVRKEKHPEDIRVALIPHYHRSETDRIVKVSRELIRHKIWQFNTGNLVHPLCYTACGRFEGAIIIGVHIWDVAGSNIIVEEAGGKVTDFSGRPWNWRADFQDCVVANPALHKRIMREIIRK